MESLNCDLLDHRQTVTKATNATNSGKLRPTSKPRASCRQVCSNDDDTVKTAPAMPFTQDIDTFAAMPLDAAAVARAVVGCC